MLKWITVIIISLIAILYMLLIHSEEQLVSLKISIDPESTSIYNIKKGLLMNISSTNIQVMVQQRFENRQSSFRSTCQRVTQYTPLANIYGGCLMYQQRYNFLVCAVPKAGVTTMIHHMRAISLQNFVPWARRFLSLQQVKTKIQEGSSILLVRHPLDRLVSAYEDRVNIRTLLDTRETRARINMALGRQNWTKVEFMDFLQYKIKYSKSNKSIIISDDLHWANYSSLCAPCTVKYKYIMKTETFDQDMLHIKNIFNITEVIPGIKSNIMEKPSDSFEYVSGMKYWRYYLQVSPCVLKEIIHLVHQDMCMFDYHLPSDLEKHATLCQNNTN